MKKESTNQPESLREELESLSPSLARLHEKASGMKVPAGYFDHMEAEVARKIGLGQESESVQTTSRESWLDILLAPLQILLRPRYAMAFAALLLLLAAGIWILRPNTPSEDFSAGMGMLSYEEIQGYVEENIDDFELELLLEYVEAEEGSSGLLLEENLPANKEMDEFFDEYLDDLDLSDLEDLL